LVTPLSNAGKITLLPLPDLLLNKGTTIVILNPNARMTEAVRLTRAGRLAEATALLQGLPQKAKSPEASGGFDRESMRTAMRGGQPIDMVPLRSGSAQSARRTGSVHRSSLKSEKSVS
jgi:hypothetical protein